MSINDFVKFSNVELKDGFWKNRYDINKKVSIGNVAKRFEETGRFDALRFNFHEKNTIKPHIFFDSDVAKWIEAVSYLIQSDKNHSGEWAPIIDEMIDCMEKAQREDGYLNSYHQQIQPELIFKIRDHHELYCAGHLIEAAIAYHIATGKDKFLKIMEKYCDCIEKAFFTEKTAAFETPGHEEIELALFLLYKHTGKEKYKAMAEGFVERRGRKADEQYVYPNYRDLSQDNAPTDELREAVGHSVRALYLYSAMADVALENNNEKLIDSLDSLFDDITKKKLYITGGIGTTHIFEGFTLPYDLPNSTGYSESCCAIAMILFAMRMRKIRRNAQYGNVIERVMYNSLLSSTSIDGKSFFYSNPVEINLDDYARQSVARRHWLPQTDRVEVFQCSCCPPNINRMIARIADVICYDENDGACIEQFIASNISSVHGDITIDGDYAADGRVKISSENYASKKIRIRKPEWCNDVNVHINGKNTDYAVSEGYLTFDVERSFTIELDFMITPRFVASNPLVYDNVGRVALTYGPIVYCIEGVDNGGKLIELSIDVVFSNTKIYNDFHGFNSIELNGFRDKISEDLYFDASKSSRTPAKLKFIPYFAFANRGRTDMLVWIRRI